MHDHVHICWVSKAVLRHDPFNPPLYLPGTTVQLISLATISSTQYFLRRITFSSPLAYMYTLCPCRFCVDGMLKNNPFAGHHFGAFSFHIFDKEQDWPIKPPISPFCLGSKPYSRQSSLVAIFEHFSSCLLDHVASCTFYARIFTRQLG